METFAEFAGHGVTQFPNLISFAFDEFSFSLSGDLLLPYGHIGGARYILFKLPPLREDARARYVQLVAQKLHLGKEIFAK